MYNNRVNADHHQKPYSRACSTSKIMLIRRELMNIRADSLFREYLAYILILDMQNYLYTRQIMYSLYMHLIKLRFFFQIDNYSSKYIVTYTVHTICKLSVLIGEIFQEFAIPLLMSKKVISFIAKQFVETFFR